MMKKLLSFLLAVFLAFTLIGIVSADMSSQTLIYDEAGLLSSNEKSKLEEEAQAIYKEHQFKSYLLIADSYDDVTQYTTDFFKKGKEDAILLIIGKSKDYRTICYKGKAKELLGDFWDTFIKGVYHSNSSWYDSAHRSLTAIAAKFGPLKRLVDEADLLSDAEEKDLLSKLDEISERQKCDLVIVTVKDLGGKTPEAFADDYFDYNGYGQGEDYSGLLLLLSMKERDWHITTTGYAIRAFTDAGLEYMSDRFVPKLSSGEYEQAFNSFAELSDKFLTQAKTDKPYDKGNLPKEPLSWIWVPLSLGVGLVTAFVVVSSMAGQLKSVEPDVAATNYIVENSLTVTQAEEKFLYKTIDKVARPKESKSSSGGSSTHTSSSGRTHGGAGGKF